MPLTLQPRREVRRRRRAVVNEGVGVWRMAFQTAAQAQLLAVADVGKRDARGGTPAFSAAE